MSWNLKSYFSIPLLGLITCLSAQVQYDVGDGKIEYVQFDSNPELVNDFIKSENGLEIVFNFSDTKYEYPLKLRKAEGWFLYCSEIFVKEYMSDRVNEKPYDSIGFPVRTDWIGNEAYAFVARKNEKYDVLRVSYGDYSIPSTMEVDETVVKIFNSEYFGETTQRILSRKGNNWSEWYSGTVIQPYEFSSPEEVPWLLCWSNFKNQFTQMRKKGYDILVPTQNCEFVKTRSLKSGKWGLFKIDEEQILFVPAKYDSLRHHEELNITEVWTGDKVGFYKGGIQIESPAYNEFRIVSLDYTSGIALNNEKGWWVKNIDSGKDIFNQPFDSIDDFIEKWLNRH